MGIYEKRGEQGEGRSGRELVFVGMEVQVWVPVGSLYRESPVVPSDLVFVGPDVREEPNELGNDVHRGTGSGKDLWS